MINGMHLCSASLVLLTSESALHYMPHLPIQLFSNQTVFFYARTYSHTNDTSEETLGSISCRRTCGLEEPGIVPLIFWFVDEPLYLLSHSRPLNDTYCMFKHHLGGKEAIHCTLLLYIFIVVKKKPMKIPIPTIC